MEEGNNNSWVTRIKFSHTLFHRSGSAREPSNLQQFDFNSLCSQSNRSIAKSPENLNKLLDKLDHRSTYGQSDRNLGRQPHNCNFNSFRDEGKPAFCNDGEFKSCEGRFGDGEKEQKFKTKQRSSCPLPATLLSDAFKETTNDKKRFSTPPPRRKDSTKNFFTKQLISLTPTKARPQSNLSSAKSSCEHLSIDRSQLYVGPRFASGAHSRLYHGEYNDEMVAVKIIHKPDDDDENEVMVTRLEKQYIREVTLLSSLKHSNIIKLVGAYKDPQAFCIITEYLSGGSLRRVLRKLKHMPLPLSKLIAIALDIARGMEYIHSQGVIHRDLKPENIIFDQDSCAKIVDFGIACEEAYCDALADDPGTYRWMAPEVIKKKPHGRKVDVYSFGLLLWEMATGRIPYEDKTPIQAAFAVINKNLRPVIPSDCPAALRTLIEKCWTLHPEKRPEFWQIVQVLEEFESALARDDGSLEQVKNLTFQDHKKKSRSWIQNLKPLHNDDAVHPMPKLL